MTPKPFQPSKYLLTILALISCAEFISVSAQAALQTTEQAKNTPPIVRGQTFGVGLNSPSKNITLIASDKDGDPLTFTIVSGPSHGTLTQVNGAVWKYTRTKNYQGGDSFRFKANDGTTDSKSATVWIVNSPHGIFQLTGGTPWQVNPNVDGLHLGVQWSEIAVTEDVSGWNWSSIDRQLQNAVTYNKQVGLSLKILSDPPAWLLTTYGIPTYLVPKIGGNSFAMVLPWDPIVQEKVNEFIAALAQHVTTAEFGSLRVDGTASFIVMGGLGIQTETHMPGPADTIPHIPDPLRPLFDISLEDEIALWQQASKDFIATYAANFRVTPYLMAAAIPLDEDVPNSTVALTDVFCYGMGKNAPECAGTGYKGYGALFGVMGWSLNENSTTDFFVNEWVSSNSPTRSTGFQFSSDYNGRTDPTPVLDRALELNAHFVEVYSSDADGQYAEEIHGYSSLLQW
jgi:hypothetical protein